MSAHKRFSEPANRPDGESVTRAISPSRHFSSSCPPPWAAAAIIALVTFTVYLPVLRAGYIWDDNISLTENPLIRSLSGLYDIWFSTKPYDYFPLTFTSFWLEWRLWGMHATGYHVVNVLLHALGAILFWRVLLRLRIPSAWLAAMVFAVHPVCVASVAWVAERKNTLALVFYLLSILWYLRFDSDSGSKRPAARKWCWLSLLAFLLALLSKTSVVTLPFVLCLCVWWRRYRSAQGVPAPAQVLGDLRRLIPFLALAMILGLVTVWFQSHRAMSGNLHQRDPLGMRLLGGTWAVWFYLAKALLPVKLNMIYPRWEMNPAWIWAYVPALVWYVVIAVCWRFRRVWGGAVVFGLGSFFVTLLPVLGFFDMSFFVYARVADHLQYLALVGVIALVVGGASSWFQNSSWPFRLGAGVVVATLSVLTWNRASVFKGQETLWRDTLDKNPRAWVACNNLGMAITNPEEKLNCYLAALQLNPNYTAAHNNLGCALLERGRFEEARAHLNRALQLDPDYAEAHNNLGLISSKQGRFGEAATQYRAALRFKPDYLPAHFNLGLALTALGQTNEAIAEFETALELNPDFARAQYQLAGLLLKQGRRAEATKWFAAAVQNQPNSAEGHYRLGLVLAEERRAGEAIQQLREALRLKPNWVEALNHLVWILAAHPESQYRNGAEAMKLAERAVELTDRKDAGTLNALAAAYAEAGRFAEAEKTARQALATATVAGQKELAGQIETRLKVYEARQPWREP